LAAVIYTDTVQTLILITGAVALTVIGLGRVGGLEHLRAMVPPDYFHMIKPISDPNFPWTGIFFGAPILGIWYWCTDQVIVQRVLSARDEGHAKAGTIFAGFLKILPVFMLVLPGIIAFALFPDQVKKPDFAYPTGRPRRTGDGRLACGSNGCHELGFQFRFHPRDLGFL
jgi:SSS family solute:Na+ symporter